MLAPWARSSRKRDSPRASVRSRVASRRTSMTTAATLFWFAAPPLTGSARSSPRRRTTGPTAPWSMAAGSGWWSARPRATRFRTPARLTSPSEPVRLWWSSARPAALVESHGYPAERCANDEPVTVFDGRAVVVTELVPGSNARMDASAETVRRVGALAGAPTSRRCFQQWSAPRTAVHSLVLECWRFAFAGRTLEQVAPQRAHVHEHAKRVADRARQAFRQ